MGIRGSLIGPERTSPSRRSVGERLEVDVRRVHVAVELRPRRGVDEPGADRDRLDAALPAGVGDVHRVLDEDDRVVVGERDVRQPSRSAAPRSADGEASAESVSISRDLEMSQFWQKRQARLQPAVPNESTDEPGRKWLSGFFSTGSTQNPEERP